MYQNEYVEFSNSIRISNTYNILSLKTFQHTLRIYCNNFFNVISRY